MRSNGILKSASDALELSYKQLDELEEPAGGSFAELIASRLLLNSQREQISHNKEWKSFAQNQVLAAQAKVKEASIEFEKFNYLEVDELKKLKAQQAKQEAKDLDEIALMLQKEKR